MNNKFIVIGLIGLLIVLSNASMPAAPNEFHAQYDANGKNMKFALNKFQGATNGQRFYQSKFSCPSELPFLCHVEGRANFGCMKADAALVEGADIKFSDPEKSATWFGQDGDLFTCKKLGQKNLIDDEKLFDFLDGTALLWKVKQYNGDDYCKATPKNTYEPTLWLDLNFPRLTKSRKNIRKRVEAMKTKLFEDELTVQFNKYDIYTISCSGEIPYSTNEKSDIKYAQYDFQGARYKHMATCPSRLPLLCHSEDRINYGCMKADVTVVEGKSIKFSDPERNFGWFAKHGERFTCEELGPEFLMDDEKLFDFLEATAFIWTDEQPNGKDYCYAVPINSYGADMSKPMKYLDLNFPGLTKSRKNARQRVEAMKTKLFHEIEVKGWKQLQFQYNEFDMYAISCVGEIPYSTNQLTDIKNALDSNKFREATQYQQLSDCVCPAELPLLCHKKKAKTYLYHCMKPDATLVEGKDIKFSDPERNFTGFAQHGDYFTCQKAENLINDEKLFDLLDVTSNMWENEEPNTDNYCEAKTGNPYEPTLWLDLNYEFKHDSTKKNFQNRVEAMKTKLFQGKIAEVKYNKNDVYTIQCFGEIPYSTTELIGTASMSTQTEESGEELKAPWWKKTTVQIILLVVALGIIGGLLYCLFGYDDEVIIHDEEVKNYYDEDYYVV